MTERHFALIVEDDTATAEDLEEILKSIGCDSITVSNKLDALASLKSRAFCFVLLDLEIKLESGSIKGHTEYGTSLLREARTMHPEHAGTCYWMPILIVSGFAREVDAAVGAMRDGADDILQKPFKSRTVSDTIRSVLERCGRATHEKCGAEPSMQRDESLSEAVLIGIPAERKRRRTTVSLGERTVALPDGSLKVLLHLVVGHLTGKQVHKHDLGARGEQGFKGISRLRDDLRGALDEGVDIIKNEYYGNYRLRDVTIGQCNTAKLEGIGDADITALAKRLRSELDAQESD